MTPLAPIISRLLDNIMYLEFMCSKLDIVFPEDYDKEAVRDAIKALVPPTPEEINELERSVLLLTYSQGGEHVSIDGVGRLVEMIRGDNSCD
jgi:hypothetical protein